jgi:hypothetical protein
MPVPFDRPSFDQIMHSLKCSGEAGDILCTHAAEEIERLLAALKVADMALDFAQAQADSERDANQLRGWRREIQKAINKAEGAGK